MEKVSNVEGLQKQTSELNLKLEDLASLLKKFDLSTKKQNQEFDSERKKVMSKIQADMDEVHERMIFLFDEIKKLSPSEELSEINSQISSLDEKINVLRKSLSGDIENVISTNIESLTSDLALIDVKVVEINKNIALLPDQKSIDTLQFAIQNFQNSIKEIFNQISNLNMSEDLDKISEDLICFSKNFNNIEKHIIKSDAEKQKLFEQINRNINSVEVEVKKIPLSMDVDKLNTNLLIVSDFISDIKEQIGHAFKIEITALERLEKKFDLIIPNAITDELSLKREISNTGLSAPSVDFVNSTTDESIGYLGEKFKALNAKINEVINASNKNIANKIEANLDFLISEVKDAKSDITQISDSFDLNSLNENILEINEYLSLFRSQLDDSLSQESKLLTRIEDKVEAVYNRDYSEKTIEIIQNLKKSLDDKHKEINERLSLFQKVSAKLLAGQESQLTKTDMDKVTKDIENAMSGFTSIPNELAHINSNFSNFASELKELFKSCDIAELDEKINFLGIQASNLTYNLENKILESNSDLKLCVTDEVKSLEDKISGVMQEIKSLPDFNKIYDLQDNILELKENLNFLSSDILKIDSIEIVNDNLVDISDNLNKFKSDFDNLSLEQKEALSNINEKVESIKISDIQELKQNIESSSKEVSEKLVFLKEIYDKISEIQEKQPNTQKFDKLEDDIKDIAEQFLNFPDEMSYINSKLNEFLEKYTNSNDSAAVLIDQIKELMTNVNIKVESNLLYLNEQISQIIKAISEYDFSENFKNLENKTDALNDKIVSELNVFVDNFRVKIANNLANNNYTVESALKDLEFRLEELLANSVISGVNEARVFSQAGNTKILELSGDVDNLKLLVEQADSKLNKLDSLSEIESNLNKYNDSLSKLNDPVNKILNMTESQQSYAFEEFGKLKLQLKALMEGYNRVENNILTADNKFEESNLVTKQGLSILNFGIENIKRLISQAYEEINSNSTDIKTLLESENITRLDNIENLIKNRGIKDQGTLDSINNLATFVVDSHKEAKAAVTAIKNKQEIAFSVISSLSNSSEVVKNSLIGIAEWVDSAGKTLENMQFAIMVIKNVQADQKDHYERKTRSINVALGKISEKIPALEDRLSSLERRIEEFEYKQTLEQIEMKELLKTIIDRLPAKPAHYTPLRHNDNSAKRREYLAKYSEKLNNTENSNKTP